MNDEQAVISVLKAGGIIAYPTEAVYGLGCDPFNLAAVTRLLALKQRASSKGLILIAANWEQILPLIKPLDERALLAANQTWPGPVTWVFPASPQAPAWLTYQHNSIALRLTAHPVARKLCELAEQPLISTSANLSGELACRSAAEVAQLFGKQLDWIVAGEVGGLSKPTVIRDIISGEIIRQ